MAMEMHSQEELQRQLFRKQLAACVRSIQWSYAIFWSTSRSHERLLEWGDGYYNGDIKTRKATQQTECRADQMGLQRSEQLRELYESLCTGDCNQQSRRPSASLSPEDLTDPEWYYLVCMSFTFNFGQDLPGKVYELKEPIWLNNAQFAENKRFCRSLLAKSALIQTVVCLPFMDGVLELGNTDLVLEDLDFVRSIVSSFWEFQIPACSEHSTSSSPLVGREEENGCLILDHEVDDTIMLRNHVLITENDSSIFPFSVNPYTPNKESEAIHEMSTKYHPCRSKEIIGNLEDFSNEDHSKIKGLIDDKFSNGLRVSVNFSESLSSPYVQNILSSPMGERVSNTMFDHLQRDGHTDFRFLGVEGDGSHYACTLSTVLGNLKHGISSPELFTFQNTYDESCFKAWRAGVKTSKNFTKTPQRMLKKILFESVWMSGGQQVKPREENLLKNKSFRTEGDDTNVNHVLSERRRREKLNEKFLILRSMIPSISKIDKASILTDTIEYLKELERRVEELESCREEADPDTRERRKYPDVAERTSDNYGNEGLFFGCQNPTTNKRKVCEIYDTEAEHQLLLSKNALVDINVTMIDKEVLVELQCPWRDFLLLEIVEALSNLRLDAHSVQSSTVDSTLTITLRAKVMSTVIASPGMIKKALQRVVARS